MKLPKVDNIRITEVTDNVLLVHQIKASAMFTRCDGLVLLPRKGINSQTVILDLNIEPEYIKAIYEQFDPVSNYVCSHTHLDHSAHVHVWEECGVRIHAPKQLIHTLLDGKNFLEYHGFLDGVSLETGQKFVDGMNYKPCKEVKSFEPGDTIKFENLEIETIHFPGHTIGHIGFFLPLDEIIHISCLGFDMPKPGMDGFGPWYGFEQCSIPQYLEDIGFAETIFLERAKLLTSSHSYIVKHPDITPFKYIREKIEQNQNTVDQAIKRLKPKSKNEIFIEEFLELDLFFPKKKMKGYIKEIYALWESWIILKHIERSKLLK